MECQQLVNTQQKQQNDDEDKVIQQIMNKKLTQFRVEIRHQQNKLIQDKKRVRLIQNKQLEQNYNEIVDQKKVQKELININCQEQIKLFNEQYIQQNMDGIMEAIMKLRVLTTNQDFQQQFEVNVQTIKNSGILNLVISFLDQSFSQYEKLQRDILWMVAHIFSFDSQSVELCVTQGIVDNLLRLFGAQSIQLRELSVLAMANISGDNNDYRKFLIDNKKIIQIITDVLIKLPSEENSELMANLAVLIRNLFGNDHLNHKIYYPLILIMQQMLLPKHLTFEIGAQVIAGTLDFVESYKQDNSILEEIVEQHSIFFQRIIELLRQLITTKEDRDYEITKNGLIFLNILCSGYDETTEKLIQIGILELLQRMTQVPNENVQHYALCIIKNISVCESDILQYLFDELIIILELQRIAQGNQFYNKKDALIAISNLCMNGDQKQIAQLVELGFLKLMSSALLYQDNDLIEKLLEGLYQILMSGQEIKNTKNLFQNPYSIQFYSESGEKYLNKVIETHKNKLILETAYKIQSQFIDILGDNEIKDEQ